MHISKLLFKTIIFAALIAFLPLTMFAQSLVFTEIMYDLPGTDDKREWCELYNYGSEAVAIVPGTTANAWRFSDGSSHTLKLVQGDATIVPGGTAILTSDNLTWFAEHPSFTGTVFDTVVSLGNASGTLGLSTASNESFFTNANYDSAWGGTGNGFSLERDSLDSISLWREAASIGGTPGIWQNFVPPMPTTTPTSTPEDPGNATTTPDQPTGNDQEPTAAPGPQTILVTQPQPTVTINELVPNPKGLDTDEEWIELFNETDVPVELAGWTMQDATSYVYTFSEDTVTQLTIPPHGYLIVKRSQSKIALNNTGGDTVKLYRPDGSLSDVTVYLESARDDVAWARFGSSWEWSTVPTPGLENKNSLVQEMIQADDEISFSSATASTTMSNWQAPPLGSIRVTEFLANQKGADNDEWIEITNSSTTTIDLSGWKLDDAEGGSKPFIVPQGTVVPRSEYLVFHKEQTKLQLGNAKDSVRILTPTGIVWQSIAYTNAPEDESYTYDPIDDDWMWTSVITPGSAFIADEISDATVLGFNATTTDAEYPDMQNSIRGIVIVPPKTLYKQRVYIQLIDESVVPVGTTVELYNYKGSFPDLVFGESIEAFGIWDLSEDMPRLKIAGAGDIQSVSSQQSITYEPASVADLSTRDAFTAVALEAEVERIAKQSVRLTDSGDTVTLRFLDAKQSFGDELSKGQRVRIAGILKFQSGNPVVYIPNSVALESVAIATNTASTTIAAAQEHIIEGAASGNSFNQWYIVFAVPFVLMVGFGIKKYVVPRLG